MPQLPKVWSSNLMTFGATAHFGLTATVPLIFLFYFFYDVAYTPLIVTYSLEILPFKVRAKGFALMVRFFILRAQTRP